MFFAFVIPAPLENSYPHRCYKRTLTTRLKMNWRIAKKERRQKKNRVVTDDAIHQ